MSEPYTNQAQTQAAGAAERIGRSRGIDASPGKGQIIAEQIGQVRRLHERINGITQQLGDLRDRLMGDRPPASETRRGAEDAPVRPDLHELSAALAYCFDQLEQLQEHVAALSRL